MTGVEALSDRSPTDADFTPKPDTITAAVREAADRGDVTKRRLDSQGTEIRIRTRATGAQGGVTSKHRQAPSRTPGGTTS